MNHVYKHKTGIYNSKSLKQFILNFLFTLYITLLVRKQKLWEQWYLVFAKKLICYMHV